MPVTRKRSAGFHQKHGHVSRMACITPIRALALHFPDVRLPSIRERLGSSRDDPNGARENDTLRPLMGTEKCFDRSPHLFSPLL
jgi:hypothetical protein